MSEIGNRQYWWRGARTILAGVIVIMNVVGCATANSAERVYHGFSIEVGNGLPAVKNVRYLYGDLGWREAKVAAPPGPLSILRAEMKIPDEFEISWESESGKHYAFKVPVLSRIKTDLKGKTVMFVIKENSVEGYVATPQPNFRNELDRFY